MIARHKTAFIITVGAATLIGGAGYIALAVYSGLVNGHIGGPLNFVLVPVLVAIATAVVTPVYVMPLAALCWAASRRWRRMRAIAPVLVLLSGLLLFALAIPLFLAPTTPLVHGMRLATVGYFLGCLCFLIYWPTLLILDRRGRAPKPPAPLDEALPRLEGEVGLLSWARAAQPRRS